MGFASTDDWMQEVTTNGKTTGALIWNKLTSVAFTAGRWYDFSQFTGTPVANAYAGTALTWTTCTETTGNGTQIFGMPHGGNVSTDTKHLAVASAVSAVATAVPGFVQWVDLQGYYPGINMNVATAQTLLGTPTLRYANGAGCRMYLVNTVASGATAHNIAASYTNQVGTSGRALPVTVAGTASNTAAHISHSGVGANNYGPWLPLAGGDTGIQSVQTITLSAASLAGTAALCIARPIGHPIPITTTGVLGEREAALQKFLQDAFSYTVVDNSPDYAKRVELQAYCKEADIRYVGLPKNPYTGYSASDSHGLALNWAYRRLLRHGGATVWAFLDHDIFPTAPYSITEKLKTQPVYGHLQVRDEVWYLWPGFCFIRAEVAAPRGLNFMPIPGADTGAGNFSLLYQHLRRADLNFPDHVYEKVSLEGEETEGRVERLDSWLHVIGASDWSKSGAVKAYRHLLK